MRWTVLIPLKSLPHAKSRLAPASADGVAHGRLVEAIRQDTIAAARDAGGVARVVLVADRDDARPHPARGAGTDLDVFVQSVPGLNPALAEAAATAAERWPDDGVAALVGDLPALRPDELADALEAAAAHPRSFVADHIGSGTTLLAARPGTALEPRFGEGSAARHGAAAASLPAGAGLRHDVDTAADLRAAAALGVGPATSRHLSAALPAGDTTDADRSPREGMMSA